MAKEDVEGLAAEDQEDTFGEDTFGAEDFDFDLDNEIVVKIEYLGVLWVTTFPPLTDERFYKDLQYLIKNRQIVKGRKVIDQSDELRGKFYVKHAGNIALERDGGELPFKVKGRVIEDLKERRRKVPLPVQQLTVIKVEAGQDLSEEEVGN